MRERRARGIPLGGGDVFGGRGVDEALGKADVEVCVGVQLPLFLSGTGGAGVGDNDRFGDFGGGDGGVVETPGFENARSEVGKRGGVEAVRGRGEGYLRGSGEGRVDGRGLDGLGPGGSFGADGLEGCGGSFTRLWF